MSKISIIIPVYNECGTIKKVISSVFRSNTLNFKKQIIVVDDGSTDGTSTLLRELKDKFPIEVYKHKINLGKGAAILTGVKRVRGDVVIIQDADLEYLPKDIVKLLRVYDPKGCPVVYGSRNMGAKHGYLSTHLVGTAITMLFNILYGTRLSDLHTGYKLFRADLITKAGLKTNGFDFCHEITAKIVKRGVPIVEIPIGYNARKWEEGKKVRAIDAWWDILTTVKLRFNQK